MSRPFRATYQSCSLPVIESGLDDGNNNSKNKHLWRHWRRIEDRAAAGTSRQLQTAPGPSRSDYSGHLRQAVQSYQGKNLPPFLPLPPRASESVVYTVEVKAEDDSLESGAASICIAGGQLGWRYQHPAKRIQLGSSTPPVALAKVG